MSILNVNTIQPIGSGTTVTVAATELKTSNFITVGTGASVTSPSANVLTLGTNSAERLRITSAGLVGINDTSPDATLSVGGSTAFIDVGAAGGNRGKIGYSSNDLYFGTSSSSGEFIFKNNVTSTDNPASSGSERVRITSAGDVGIGTAVPVTSSGYANLSLAKTSGGQVEFKKLSSGRTHYIWGDDNLNIAAAYNVSGSGAFIVNVNGNNEKLRVDSSGRLGLGVVPEAFHSNNKAVIRGDSGYSILGRGDNALNIGQNFYYDSSDAGKYIANGEASVYQQTDGQHVFYSAVSGSANASASLVERLRIDASGRVTKPNQPLAVIGTTQNNPTPSAGSVVQFDYVGTNRGNHYNTSNYTFTCPVAGDYMVIFRHSRKGWCGDLDLQKNGTTHAYLELRETGLNGAGTPVPDWQAGSYSFIVPCAANDVLRWVVGAVYTSTGSGGYLLDGYNHIKYDAVTYYLIG